MSHFQCHFREFGSASNWSHIYRPQGTPSARDLHIQLLHLRPATRTAEAISVQTVNSVSGNLICMLHVLVRVTDLSGQHFIYLKLHISDWLFVVSRPKRICALIMYFNQTAEVPHLSAGWITFGLWQIVLKTSFFVCIRKTTNILHVFLFSVCL